MIKFTDEDNLAYKWIHFMSNKKDFGKRIILRRGRAYVKIKIFKIVK